MKVLKSTLDSGGIIAGLQFLNSRVPHRYTGIYKFHGDMIHRVFLYDKLDGPQPFAKSTPVAESFAGFITADQPFSVTDASSKVGLIKAVKRSSVVSYFGVGMSQVPGKVFGSLCHFDRVRQVMPPGEDVFLLHAREALLSLLRGFDR